jgi:predicted lipase
MISDITLAQLAAATYSCDPTWTGAGLDQSIHACRTNEDGLVVIAFRGSIAARDWFLDFAALPIRATLLNHATLGYVHSGFLAAAMSVLPRIALAVEGKPYALTGHSLGGAIALMVGAIMADENNPPQRICTFGAPKVGFAKYAEALADVHVDQYRRGNDPVPSAPLALPGVAFVHARLPLIAVGVPQSDPFASHHMPGYLEDVTGYVTKLMSVATGGENLGTAL